LEGTINFPVEYTKAQLQVGNRFNSPLEVVRATVKERGAIGMYRGFSAFASMVTTAAAVRFYAYNTGLQLFGGDGVGFTPMQLTTVAGMFSGVVEATVCLTPGEAISVAMLHDNMRKAPQFAGKGQFGTAAALIKAEGVTVLWNGWTPQLCKLMTCSVIRFVGFATLKEKLLSMEELDDGRGGGGGGGGDGSSGLEDDGVSRKRTKQTELSMIQAFGCGAVVGALSVPATHPIDVIKTNMMAYKGPHASAAQRGMLAVGMAIFRAEGARAFFKGVGTRLVRVTSEQAFTFMFYDKISIMLEDF